MAKKVLTAAQFFSGFWGHLLVFIVIEILFVLILFREFPSISFVSVLGLLHASYWLILVLAGWMREKTRLLRQKFLATYVPVLYHVFIHVWAGRIALHNHSEDIHSVHSHEQDIVWLLIGAVILGVLIYLGETWLHRSMHCQTHHTATHQHCHDPECEDIH